MESTSSTEAAAPTAGHRRLARVSLGVALSGAGFVPVGRWLLASVRTGPAGTATVAALDGLNGSLVVGGLSVLLVAMGIGLLPSMTKPLLWIEEAGGRAIRRLPRKGWPVLCALIAFSGAALAGHLLLLGEPTLVDEMSQLAHARSLAGMQPSVDAPAAALRIQNGLMVHGRWVSIYPPGHTWVLALALRLGLLGWIGALLWGATVGFASDLFLRVGRSSPTASRTAGLLLALSPIGWLIGAGYLSHLSAALAITIGLWVTSRITEASVGAVAATPVRLWSDLRPGLVLGMAAGWAVCSRPLTGLVLAVLLPTGWLLFARGRRAMPVLAGATMGGLPFALGLGLWNLNHFGSPLTFGYGAAFGPSHGLGFHLDPWGNSYGIVEAIGYTFSDLFLLGSALFETPISIVGLLGLLVLIGRRQGTSAGESVALAWIGLAVAANAIYWHHGLHFGPRMLFETLPAWALLLSLTAGRALESTGGSRAGGALRMALLATVVGAVGLNLPARLASSATGEGRRAQLPTSAALAALPDSAVVFVHGSWASRVAGRLAQAGIRADSIETALRRNDLCGVDSLARLLVTGGPGGGGEAAMQSIDWTPRPGTPADLQMVEIGPENRIRLTAPAPRLTEACLQEIASDRLGGLELEAMRWRSADRGIVWLRDLGPEFNPVIPGAWMLVSTERGGRPLLVDYVAGEELIWRSGQGR